MHVLGKVVNNVAAAVCTMLRAHASRYGGGVVSESADKRSLCARYFDMCIRACERTRGTEREKGDGKSDGKAKAVQTQLHQKVLFHCMVVNTHLDSKNLHVKPLLREGRRGLRKS
eukprot:1148253-Pelagomonas_calceolata.AAC.3